MSVVTITESAEEQITQICLENNADALRLDIKGGGCAGFEYDWGIIQSADDILPDAEVIQRGTAKLVINRESIFFLLGSEIDYVRSLIGSQFDIRNPNASSACGCGVSVNFNMDAI